MLVFFKKVSFIIIPIIIVFAFPLFVEIFSGEFLTTESIINKQLNNNINVIYGTAYSDSSLYYKAEMVRRINPDILALGNSKILTMREGFFNRNIRFYNAGGTAGDIASFRKFLEVTGIRPSIIIMTVEPLHFDPVLVVSTTISNKKYQSTAYISKVSSIISQSWVQVYYDYFQNKFTIDKIINSKQDIETIGLNARVNGSGLRNDGSYHYGKQYESKELRDQKINKAITFIENKTTVEGKEFFSTPALNELDNFLAYCKERNIYVIGYVPPTPKIIEDTYKKYSKYEYMFHTYEKTLPVFQKYNFDLYNFFSMSSLQSGDEETIDEYHTSEKVMLRAIIKMSENSQVLSKVTNINYLEKVISSTKDKNDVFK